MSNVTLKSTAEKKAEKAESLDAFSGFKLLHIKKEVAKILSLIGRDGIFDEYTKHDISHIDKMLDSLDWIIPEETQDKLTPADWLMITLSIYFHDLGMLVTKNEFKERNKSSFPQFKQKIFDGEFGLDYKEKIMNITGGEDQIDRFIYQELVRRTHAERIKYWIISEKNPNFSNNQTITDEIKKLLENVDPMFKRDLALICESHHLSDLEDYEKYKPKQQYGSSKDYEVNLLYSALILRTADLLHITSDRTPSIEYLLINPTDPISQDEWAKQSSVKTVRRQDKKNKEGNIDKSIPSDTFEVLAYFENDDGFFGLISYLNYANKELKENYKYNELANKRFGTNYRYPWRNIDDSQIVTKDFERKQLEFVLDQNKILDLLVGHTLYNDSSVVLRELTQNAIDATKLKQYELKKENKQGYTPEIQIRWDEFKKELSFVDNGTGMSLDIIQNHLLKVGSSRYQEEGFKKDYPEFSPISRFGIGLLTCFLIADDIDILTKSSEMEKAILLKIKKIHGKYLLKHVSVDKIPNEIKEHGTQITLFVRANTDLSKIEQDLKKWILIPKCTIELKINETKRVSIGHKSPKEILTNYLKENGFNIDDKSIKIEQFEKDGIVMAFALQYVDYLKEWTFLNHKESDNEDISPVGICIEGIRVGFNTPGFLGKKLYAVVDSSGKNAPKTNVARSNIEATQESEELLYSIYQIYLEHIMHEQKNLTESGFSISWAVNEVNWLLSSFLSERKYDRRSIDVENPKSLEKALMEASCILIEKNGQREICTINKLKEFGYFWTINCASYNSADALIREVKSSNSSALKILESIFGEKEVCISHIDNLLCNFNTYSNIIEEIIRRDFQIDAIKIIPDQRRLDLRWTSSKKNIWKEITIIPDNDYYHSSRLSSCYIQLEDIDIDESIEQIAIQSYNSLYFLKKSELNTYLTKLIEELSDNTMENNYILSAIVSLIDSLFFYSDIDKIKIEEFIDSRIKRVIERFYRDMEQILWKKIDKEEFISIILKTNFIKYDTTIWYKRDFY